MNEYDNSYWDGVFESAESKAEKRCGDVQVVELLKPYVEVRPKHGMAWLLLGDGLRVLGRFAEASEALNRALELAPDAQKSFIYGRLGLLHEKHKSPKEAEKWYKIAVEKDGNREGWILVIRGSNLAVLGKYEAALDCYRLALDAENIDREEVYLNMGLVSMAIGNYQDALSYMRKALEVNPEYPEAECWAASLLDLGL